MAGKRQHEPDQRLVSPDRQAPVMGGEAHGGGDNLGVARLDLAGDEARPDGHVRDRLAHRQDQQADPDPAQKVIASRALVRWRGLETFGSSVASLSTAAVQARPP